MNKPPRSLRSLPPEGALSALRAAGRALTRPLALMLFAALAACDLKPSASSAAPFNGVDITGAEYARNFALTDHAGQPRTLADFKGKVVVVFFGFTQCPDVCPTTMAELAEVKRALGPDGERVQGVFITVDPERDTPEVLKAYVTAFDPSFVALRGTAEQTLATAKEFKVFYAKAPSKGGGGGYTVDHTAGAFVIDPSGRVRVFTRYGSGAQPLAQDLKRLLATG
jgi:protein SCO1